MIHGRIYANADEARAAYRAATTETERYLVLATAAKTGVSLAPRRPGWTYRWWWTVDFFMWRQEAKGHISDLFHPRRATTSQRWDVANRMVELRVSVLKPKANRWTTEQAAAWLAKHGMPAQPHRYGDWRT